MLRGLPSNIQRMAGLAGPVLCFCWVKRKRSQEANPGPDSQCQLQLSIWDCHCPGALSGCPTLPGSLPASWDRVSPALLPLMFQTPSSILSRTRAHLPAGHLPACFCLPKHQVSFARWVLHRGSPKAKSRREWWVFKAWAKVRGFRALAGGLLPLSGKQRVSGKITSGLREKSRQKVRASSPESASRSLWAGLVRPPSPRGRARGGDAGRPPVAARQRRSGPVEGGAAAAAAEAEARRPRGGHGGTGARRAFGPGRDFLRARRVGSAEPLRWLPSRRRSRTPFLPTTATGLPASGPAVGGGGGNPASRRMERPAPRPEMCGSRRESVETASDVNRGAKRGTEAGRPASAEPAPGARSPALPGPPVSTSDLTLERGLPWHPRFKPSRPKLRFVLCKLCIISLRALAAVLTAYGLSVTQAAGRRARCYVITQLHAPRTVPGMW